MQIQLHHADDVRAIHRGKNPFRTRQSAEFFRWQDDAGGGRDVAEEQHTRPRRNRIIEKIQHRSRIRHRLWQGNLLHHNPIPFRAQVPRLLAPGMLLVGHQHFIARLHIKSIRDVAVRLRRVAH